MAWFAFAILPRDRLSVNLNADVRLRWNYPHGKFKVIANHLTLLTFYLVVFVVELGANLRIQ